MIILTTQCQFFVSKRRKLTRHYKVPQLKSLQQNSSVKTNFFFSKGCSINKLWYNFEEKAYFTSWATSSWAKKNNNPR